MKKIIIKIIIFAIVFGGIFGTKRYIDYKTYDYKPEVKEALTNYFVNNDRNSLGDILNLLDKYKDDQEIREGIQKYSFDIVGSWFTYVDQKYACSESTYRTNKNSCMVLLDEFKNLNDKLVVLYGYKSKEGYTIIRDGNYNNLINQTSSRVKKIESSYIKTSRNPQSAEEERLEKCKKATECENCRDGVCKCYYIANSVREELTCQKSEEFIESLKNN